MFKLSRQFIVFVCSFLFWGANSLFAQDSLTVDFSLERGLFDQAQSVSLSTLLPLSTIYYTLDGSTPDGVNGSVYSTPIPITTTTFIRAVAQNADTLTKVFTHSYLYLNDVVNQPNTISGFPVGELEFDGSLKNDPTYGPQMLEGLQSIPSISIVLSPLDFVTAHSSSNEVPVSMEIIYPDGQSSIQENCGLKRVGGSSYNSPKRNWRLTFRSIYGAGKLRASIYGPGAADEHDQIALRPGYHGCIITDEGKDINDQVLRNLQIYMDEDSVGIHGFFAHLYINGAYWGVYNPSERANNGFAEAYYGGAKEDWDAIKRKAALDGSITAWNALNNMVDNLDMTDSLNYIAVQEYIDIEQFINYILLCNYGPHSDVHYSAKNSFAIRDRTKTHGFRFYIWDSEPALWSDWRYTNSTHDSPPFNNIWNALLSNDEFKIQLADQMHCHTKEGGILSPDFVMNEYERLFDLTQKPLISEAARWKDKTIYEKIFAERDSNLYSYLPNRTDVLINTYRNYNQYPDLDPVAFSQFGGEITEGFQLLLQNPNLFGSIYYTTDGSDPRAYGGGINSSAQQYNSPINITNPITDIRVRVLHNGNWSASCPARFYLPQDLSGLVINEIHYNPSDTCGSEFIEFKNIGTEPLYLGDCFFAEGIHFRFPVETVIAPDSLLVLARQADSFLVAYGFQAFDSYRGKLDNGGEILVLKGPDGFTIDSLRYNDKFPWDSLADGYGPSLELITTQLDNKLAANWAASINSCGSPRQENSIDCSGTNTSILINEVMYNYGFKLDGLDAQDWIELYNTSTTDTDISTWYLQDEDSMYILPAGTIIPAKSYLVLVDSLNDFLYAHPGISQVVEVNGLGLNGNSEQIAIFNQSSCPVAAMVYGNNAPWPESADGKGFSLTLRSDTLDPSLAASWQASGNYAGTPGSPNESFCEAVPQNIVINEIAYHPNPAYDTKDWIELYNPNDQSIDLSAWELHDSQNYFTLPAGTIIQPDGYIVIAQDLPAFYTKYGSSLPSGIIVLGGFNFGFSGDGEWIALLTKERCWVDGLHYNDSYPWPLEADGQGPTLALMSPDLDNSLAGSWAPSTWGAASLGTPGLNNNLPDPCIAYQSFSETELPLINEISYNDDPVFQTGNWLEIYNPSSISLDLSNWMLVDEDSVFVFPAGTNLAAGGYLLLAEDPLALASLHPEIPVGTIVLGPLGIKFDNKGERLLLYSDSRCLIDSLRYNDKYPWPENEIHDPIIGLYQQGVDNALGNYWAAVDQKGTPGQANVWDCQPDKGFADLQLWLKADQVLSDGTPIASWTDHSGLGNHATQTLVSDQAQYYADQLNGHGVLRFDGVEDWFKINGVTQTLATNSTVFAVIVPRADIGDGYYLSTHKGGSNRIKMGHRQNGELIYDDDVPSIQSGNFIDRPSITAFTIHDAETEIQGYVNGVPGFLWTWPAVNDVDRASIGQEFDGQGNDNQTSNHWEGDLAEMMVFAGIMGHDEIQSVTSYLNIKYGVGVAAYAHQYFPYKNYEHDIAGIGRDIKRCLDQNKSRGIQDILTVETLLPLHNEDFLTWGNDGGSTLSDDSILNVPDGVSYRMQRVWRLAETHETDQLIVSFDLSGEGWAGLDPRAFVLLIDDDADFSDARVINPISGTNPNFEIDLADGEYISLGVQEYVLVELKGILSGAWETSTALMRDDLRLQNLIPDTDPYMGTQKLDSALLQISGNDAIVDWVMVSLYSAIDSGLVLQKTALIQRDGDIVGTDENNTIFLPVLPGDYFVGLGHRNHLGVISSSSQPLSENSYVFDFITSLAGGTDAQKQIAPNVYGLWAGDANGDGKIIFQGSSNDPATVFLKVLTDPENSSFSRNFIIRGYSNGDTNLDGNLIFQGSSTDISPIFINVLSHPANTTFKRNYIISAQLP